MRKIILFLVLIILFSGVASASWSDTYSSSATPTSIFKCQPSIITISFSTSGITAVNAYLVSVKAVQPMIPGSGRTNFETQNTTVVMIQTSPGIWQGTFGNDATLLWGNRSITFGVTNGGYSLLSSPIQIMVYSDRCTGTGVTSYKNISNGIGMPYTDALLTTDISLYDWLMSPYLAIIDVIFYFLIIILIVFMTWMKSKNYISTTLVAVLLILAVSEPQYVPPEYRGGILIIISLAITALLAIVFVKRGQ